MQKTLSLPDPEVLGRILLLQSTLHVVPYGEKMGEFLCRGISEIPGINTVDIILNKELVYSHSNDHKKNIKKNVDIDLTTTHRKYGILRLHINDPDSFEPYSPYLYNTVNLISLMLENRRQEAKLMEFNTNLELQVREQTSTLRKANQALQQSEIKYKNLIENIPGVIYRCALNAEWQIVFLSEEIESLSGYPASDFVEKKIRTLTDITHQDDRQLVKQEMEIGVKNHSPYQFEYRVVHANGDIRWVYEKGQSVKRKADKHIYLEGAIFDITEKKEAEEKLRVNREQNRLLKEIATTANVARDIKNALKITLEKLCEYSLCSVGHVFLPADDGSNDLVPSDIWFLEEQEKYETFVNNTKSIRFPIGVGLPGRIMKTREPAWITDIKNDANFPRGKDIGLHSGFGFPVILNDELIAVFELFSKEKKTPDAALINLLHQIRAQLAYVIQRKKAETKLLQSEAHHRAILEASRDPLVTIDSYGKILFVSDSVESVFGWPSEELIGQSVNKLMPSPYKERHDGYLQHYRKTGKTWILNQTRELTAKRKDGTVFPCEISVTRIKIPGNDVLFTGILKDITDRKKNETELRDYAQRLKIHVEQTPMGVIEWDLDFRITEWNHAAEKIFGYQQEEALGLTGHFIIPEENRPEIDEIWKALISKTGGVQSTNENITKDGNIITCDWYNTTLTDDNGKVIGVASLVQDITERINSEKELRRLATYDTLTNLPNRSLFDELLRQTINSSSRTNNKHALLFLDLDHFKNINDSLGHSAGDLLLKNVAARLLDCTRKDDCVSRFGGDEFVILLNNIDKPSGAADVAEKILSIMSEPYSLKGTDTVITPSIGIVIYPNDGRSPNELLRNADTAMYYAKNSGRSNYKFFTDNMNLRVRERMDMERNLRHALNNNELVCYYQPKVDLKTGDMTGVETLARWFVDEKEHAGPGVFVPVAEETGLIIPLDQHIIKSALYDVKSWVDKNIGIKSIALNLSTQQFRHELFVNTMEELLNELKLPPDIIEFEITELTIMENSEKAINLMHRLKDMGISLTIDDFGTGYSSLNYLKQFPVDTLKIDISFIRDMTKSEKDKNMVASIIGLAHNLDLKVVAEGVETNEQLEILKELDCDIAQGFLFSEAIPSSMLLSLLTQEKKILN